MPFSEEVARMFTSPIFWFVTVFIGLLLNVLANYLTRGFDRAGSFISQTFKKSSERKRALNAAVFARIRSDRNFEIDLMLREIRQRIRASFFFMLCVAMFAFYFAFGRELSAELRWMLVAGCAYAAFRCVSNFTLATEARLYLIDAENDAENLSHLLEKK